MLFFLGKWNIYRDIERALSIEFISFQPWLKTNNSIEPQRMQFIYKVFASTCYTTYSAQEINDASITLECKQDRAK